MLPFWSGDGNLFRLRVFLLVLEVFPAVAGKGGGMQKLQIQLTHKSLSTRLLPPPPWEENSTPPGF